MFVASQQTLDVRAVAPPYDDAQHKPKHGELRFLKFQQKANGNSNPHLKPRLWAMLVPPILPLPTWRINPDDINLWAVTFDYDGTDFSEFFNVDSSPNDQSKPSVAYNAIDDEFLVVYRNEIPTVCNEVVSQRLSAGTDSISGSRVTISTCSSGNTRFAQDVAYNPMQNNYLITYIHTQDSTSRSFAAAMIASNDLSALSPEFQLRDDDTAYDDASVALGQGEYLIVWINYYSEIYGRRVNFDGTPAGPGDGFLVATSPFAYNPWTFEVSASMNGYWVEWENLSWSPDTSDINGNFIPMGSDQPFSEGFPIEAEIDGPTSCMIACRWQGVCLVAYSSSSIVIAGRIEGWFPIRRGETF